MKYYLDAVSGSLRGMKFPIERRLIIGRDPGSDVQLVEHGVSRQHSAVLLDDQERLFIMDLASSNGTFLNDTSVGREPLSVGDRVRIGPSEFVVCEGQVSIAPDVLEQQQLRLASGPAVGVTNDTSLVSPEELARLRDLGKR